MTTGDERMKVLQMLEDGKVSAEEAASLLRALTGKQQSGPQRPERVWNEGRLGDYEQDKTRYETELVGDGYALNDRADSINMIDSVTWAVGGLAVASLGTALYFWVAGDPPGKYDHLSQETRVETSWDLTPSVGPGGAGVAACFRF